MNDDLGFLRSGRGGFDRVIGDGFDTARIAIAGGAFRSRRQVLQIGADEIQPFAAIDLVDAAATATATASAAATATALFARRCWLRRFTFFFSADFELAIFAFFAAALAATTATAAAALAVIAVSVAVGGGARRCFRLVLGRFVEFVARVRFFVLVNASIGGRGERIGFFGFNLYVAALLFAAACRRGFDGGVFLFFKAPVENDDLESRRSASLSDAPMRTRT